jgi:hypothetical protein
MSSLGRIPEEATLIMSDTLNVDATSDRYDKQLGLIIIFGSMLAYVYYRLAAG